MAMVSYSPPAAWTSIRIFFPSSTRVQATMSDGHHFGVRDPGAVSNILLTVSNASLLVTVNSGPPRQGGSFGLSGGGGISFPVTPLIPNHSSGSRSWQYWLRSEERRVGKECRS